MADRKIQGFWACITSSLLVALGGVKVPVLLFQRLQREQLLIQNKNCPDGSGDLLITKAETLVYLQEYSIYLEVNLQVFRCASQFSSH